MNNVYYNPQDVADQLGVSKLTLLRWANHLETNVLMVYRDNEAQTVVIKEVPLKSGVSFENKLYIL